MPIAMTVPSRSTPPYVPPANVVSPLASNATKGVSPVQFRNIFALSAPNQVCKGCGSAKPL